MATILVVDDDPDTRDLLSRFLERVGHRPVPAANGWEALIALDNRSVDLILLDVMMPGMDGPTFLRILRSSRGHEDTAVVAVSALDPDRVESKLGPLGVVAILPKKGDLLPKLRDVVRQHAASPESAGQDPHVSWN